MQKRSAGDTRAGMGNTGYQDATRLSRRVWETLRSVINQDSVGNTAQRVLDPPVWKTLRYAH